MVKITSPIDRAIDDIPKMEIHIQDVKKYMNRIAPHALSAIGIDQETEVQHIEALCLEFLGTLESAVNGITFLRSTYSQVATHLNDGEYQEFVEPITVVITHCIAGILVAKITMKHNVAEQGRTVNDHINKLLDE